MEEQIQHLVERTWKKFQTIDLSRRLLIAVGGIPGSGKTSLATHVASRLNALHHSAQHTQHPHIPTPDATHPDPSQPDVATALPLDGYHLTRAQLAALPNSAEAIFRRGAAFTFDGTAYLKLIQKLRAPLEPTTKTIYAPSFDHAVKDPVSDSIAIHPSTRIVLVEGNYVALNRSPWSDAAKLMDEIWFVEVPIPIATARLVKRHVAAGISPTPEHALKRASESDMRNGREIIDGRMDVDEVITSVEEEHWKTEDLKEMEEMHRRGEFGGGEEEENQKLKPERMDSIAMMAKDGVGL